jgi:DNA-binding transcriptional MerR regulator
MKRPVMPRVLKGHRHTYRTREFAALAGVTVRTLRYYDRIGLLMPARSPAGYRLYTRGDLEVLREIVALKAIGFPLSTITGLRRGTPADVAVAMRAQRRALEDKARLLNKAIRAVADHRERCKRVRTPTSRCFVESGRSWRWNTTTTTGRLPSTPSVTSGRRASQTFRGKP